MIKSFLVLLFLFPLSNYAQVESKPILYLNEELEQIDKMTYANQVLKSIYREHTINKDSITIKKLRKLYEFDSLNSIQLEQVQKVINKYLNITDFDKNIIIAYRDSLLGYDEFVSSVDQKIAHDAMDMDSEKKYLKRRMTFDSNQKKCKKFVTKNNTIAIYGYTGSKNFVFEPKNYTNERIPSVLRSLFFQGKKRGTLILKPNGQYFYYTYLTKKQIIKMLNSDWKKYIKDYNLVMKNDNIYTMKFIDEMNAEHKTDMRELAIKQRNKGSRNSGNMRSNTHIRLKTPYNCFGYASY